MTDQEKNLLDHQEKLLDRYIEESCRFWTLEDLIDDHRGLVAQRVEVEADAKEAFTRGYREGLEHGLRSCESLEGLTRREE